MIGAETVEGMGLAFAASATVAGISHADARRQGCPEGAAFEIHFPWAFSSLAASVLCAAALHQLVPVVVGLALVGVWCRMWAEVAT